MVVRRPASFPLRLLASVLAIAGAAAAEAPSTSVAAQAHAAAAEQAEAAGRPQEAVLWWRRAVSASPDDAHLRARLAQAERAVASSPGGDPAQVGPEPEAVRAAALAGAQAARERAAPLEATDPGAAADLLEAARSQLEVADRTGALRPEIAAITRRIADLRQSAAEHADDAAASGRALVSRQATADRQAERAHAGDAYQIRIERIRALMDRGLNELALTHARALVRDFPADADAERLYADLLDRAIAARRLEREERDLWLRDEIFRRVEESLIPEGLDGYPDYPADWSQRRADRPAARFLRAPAVSEWEEALADRLAQRVSVDARAQGGLDVLRFLAQQGGINLVIAPEVAAANEAAVTLRVRDMRLDHAIGWVCEQMGVPWTLSRGAVFIGAAVADDGALGLHDIANLVFRAPDAGNAIGQIGLGADGPGGGGAAPAGGIFGGAAAGAPGGPSPQDIVDLIKRAISPRTWTTAGYSIEARGNTLFIVAPPSVHALVEEFIRNQERINNLMVRIETRWITTGDNFMEEIGVQWTSGPFLNGPIYGFQQTNQNSIVAGSTTSPLPPVGASGLRGGGLEGQIAVLSQPQLSAIFNAVERTGRLRTLQAPSVTTVSGVRAVAGFVEQVGYIASYDVTDQNYDPVVDVLNLGAVIDVRPIVSADRRYVTMELQPAIASAEFFIETITTVPYAGGVPLGATPVDVDGDGLVDYYLGGTAQPYNLELPNIALRRLAATVQVPDRGTLIMGGFGSHLEQFSTSRVPVLGDVPFLGRLFGARGRYGQRLQWNLLVTATILPYDELEIQQ